MLGTNGIMLYNTVYLKATMTILLDYTDCPFKKPQSQQTDNNRLP